MRGPWPAPLPAWWLVLGRAWGGLTTVLALVFLGLEVRVADILHVAATVNERLLSGRPVAGELVGGPEVLVLGSQGYHILHLHDGSSKYARAGGDVSVGSKIM